MKVKYCYWEVIQTDKLNFFAWFHQPIEEGLEQMKQLEKNGDKKKMNKKIYGWHNEK